MHRKRLAAAVLLAAALTGALAPVAAAHPGRPGHPGAVQRQLDLLTARDGVPGALAYDGRTTRTSGVADLESGRAMTGERGRFRLASDTKAFTATAVLRLVADGRLGLGDRAGSYVPQLADSPLTVRQLLKQTSGLPEYSALVDWTRPGTPEEYLALALDAEPVFEPGTDWGYSNTNYLVLGMVIDEVSGVGFRTYVERTILRPLHLDDTYWPAPGELDLRGPHARNYGVHPAHPQDGRVDVTELPGYEFGASGGLVSTPVDLNAFWDGLFGGRLLPGWAVRLMTRDTTDIGGRDVYPAGSRYGYGVASIPLSCGGVYWGHGGDLPGGSVGGGRATGGRGTVTVYTTTWAAEGDSLRHLQGTVDAALCAKRR
ncbi:MULTISPECIES: serine hydrolase [Streptomyces]|uniref:Secreted peptidase n=2 Tax=Streptomyces TaxID=1883 RepID=Q93IZ9_STRCO|nr:MULTISPECIES: serine hydrolase domain-containing protein [Streptomyces]MBQ0948779.1 beta-lactamase family protein [Streptomyces sp. RK76]MCW8122931.1 beta-lactamase family protein [Streptomyces anthocyanicus]MDX2924413.1 serine hydrolase [Streptomyces sp. NRRL_B-16638]MDX3315634.1 serine hydrolase [Streptomyces sp. ME03-5684b]MDX3365979.1 serine hydrolase [Streptomyces sp. ME02-6987-2C]